MLSKIATPVLIIIGLILLIFFAWDATNKDNALSKVGTGISNFSNIFSSSDESTDKTDEISEPAKTGKIRKLDSKTDKKIEKTKKTGEIEKTEKTEKTDKTDKTKKTEKTTKTEKQPDKSVPPYILGTGSKISYSIEDDLVIVVRCERKLTPAERDKLKGEIKEHLKQYIGKLTNSVFLGYLA